MDKRISLINAQLASTTQVIYRLLMLSMLLEEQGTIVVSFASLGQELDRFGVVCDRLIRMPQRLVQMSTVIVEIAYLWGVTNGSGELTHR